MNSTTSMSNPLTCDDIEAANFSTLVGFTNEPNTPSGAYDTLRLIVETVGLRAGACLLDVGCNTGFASIELAAMSQANITGIDVNPASLNFARYRADQLGLKNVKFELANACSLPYGDHCFDVVYCNNVTSFIADKSAAVTEYLRVLREGGALAVVPIYYHRRPPTDVWEQVCRAVGTEVPIRGKEYWSSLFERENLRLIKDDDFEYIPQSNDRIRDYASQVMSQEHLRAYPLAIRSAMQRRLEYYYSLFNENLKYAMFSVMIYRKIAFSATPILFITRRASR